MNHCEILIIDDDTDDIEILTEAFNASGVKSVHAVTSVSDAYKYLKEVYPECIPKLIITDLYLPVTTGAEFLRQMKSIKEYRDIHVVIVSSTRSESEVEKYKLLGALDYVAKPISYSEYLDVVAKIKGSIESKNSQMTVTQIQKAAEGEIGAEIILLEQEVEAFSSDLEVYVRLFELYRRKGEYRLSDEILETADKRFFT
jgi:CheY-like chemotaxis protein